MQRLPDSYMDDYCNDEMGFSLSLSKLTSPLKSIEDDISDFFKDVLPTSTYQSISSSITDYKDIPEALLTDQINQQINVFTSDPRVQEMAVRSGARATATTFADALTDQYLRSMDLYRSGNLLNAVTSFKAPAGVYVVGGLSAIIAYRTALKILLPKRR